MEDGSITDDQISMRSSVQGHDWKPRFQSSKKWCGRYTNGEIIVRIQFTSVVTITSVYFEKQDEITGWFHYYDANKRDDLFTRRVCILYPSCLLLIEEVKIFAFIVCFFH